MTTFWRLAALAAAAVVFAGSAQADPGQLTVDDKARVFSAEGIKKAEDAFRAVEFKAPTQFTVVTFPEVPANKTDALAAAGEDKNKRTRFFREWAQELASRRGAKGPFTLISMKPGRVECVDDRQTDVKRNFDDTDLANLSKKFTGPFGEANKAADPARKTALHDAALLDAANYVAEQLKNTTVPTAAVPAGRANAGAGALAAAGDGGGSNLGTYICLGVVGLGALWLIVGVIRALSNRGPAYGGPGYGGGPGMAGGYGGGYGGGGGGGFMSGLMGGMLGGVAGSYLYNNMFGGGSSYGGGYGATPADGTSAGAGGAVDDGGAGDYAGGGSAGGDFGGDDAGGYADGGNDYGGGDFGGGGDYGGGDSGGGGGDF